MNLEESPTNEINQDPIKSESTGVDSVLLQQENNSEAVNSDPIDLKESPETINEINQDPASLEPTGVDSVLLQQENNLEAVNSDPINSDESPESSSSDSSSEDESSSSSSESESEEVFTQQEKDTINKMKEQELTEELTVSGIKTKNEIDASQIEVKEVEISIEITEPITKVGSVSHWVEDTIVIKSLPLLPAHDLDSLICTEEREVIGKIFETFGLVTDPYYSVRFPKSAPVEEMKQKFIKGTHMYVVDRYSQYLVPSQLYSKGSDASSNNDEEPSNTEMEYSDDEEEQKAKRQKRNKNKNKRQQNNNNDNNNGLPLPYTPLQRPNFMPTPSPNRQQFQYIDPIQHYIQNNQQNQMVQQNNNNNFQNNQQILNNFPQMPIQNQNQNIIQNQNINQNNSLNNVQNFAQNSLDIQQNDPVKVQQFQAIQNQPPFTPETQPKPIPNAQSFFSPPNPI